MPRYDFWYLVNVCFESLVVVHCDVENEIKPSSSSPAILQLNTRINFNKAGRMSAKGHLRTFPVGYDMSPLPLEADNPRVGNSPLPSER
jgi:hypothetical protein